MLTGKKPVQAAVSCNFLLVKFICGECHIFLVLTFIRWHGLNSYQLTTKKSGSVKPGAVKKADGAGQSKALGSFETEDVEVIC